MTRVALSHISVKCIVALGMISLMSSCSTDVSVPDGESIDGCYYYGNDMIMNLKRDAVSVEGVRIASFKPGKDKSGSYVIFKPALHVIKNNGKLAIKINRDLDQNYLQTIVELGRVVMAMPEEPLGQANLVRKKCYG
jgi:hypothetical protein